MVVLEVVRGLGRTEMVPSTSLRPCVCLRGSLHPVPRIAPSLRGCRGSTQMDSKEMSAPEPLVLVTTSPSWSVYEVLQELLQSVA